MKKLKCLFLFLLTSNLFAGQVFYVTTSGSDSNDGKSWATAFANVQSAIDAAASVATSESPSEVWIAKGTYKHGSAMTMKNNVAIYGGFAGTETSKDQRVAGNNTILDGEGKYRVFYNNYTEENPLTNSAKLDNVTIKNGYIASISGRGAGMYNYYASPEITNCIFSSNRVYYNSSKVFSIAGGGMYNKYSNPMLINCTFSDNSVMGYTSVFYESVYSFGGGMCNEYSKPILMNCTFYKNSTLASSDGAGSSYGPRSYGGGIFNTNSESILINCTFYANSSYFKCSSSSGSKVARGGGVANFNNLESGVVFINCIFWENIITYYYNTVDDNIYNSGTIAATMDTSIIQDGTSFGVDATNIIYEDPNLMPYGEYGGVVPTIPVSAGSPAIGAGIVDENTPKTDARGVIRSTTAPTIGAYEFAPPTIIETSKSVLGTINQDVSISISAKSALGDDNVAYQWQILNANGEWINIEGATESTYTIENCQAEMAGSKYRCIVANVGDGVSITSNEATLTVYPSVSQATLSTNRITIVDGGYGYLEVSSDAFQPTYKWYYSADTGLTWVEIENSNSSVLEFPVSKSMNRYQYKCIVTDGGGTSVESDKAVLIVNSTAITISQDIADTTAFIGKETLLSVSANSSSTLGYQWQVSTDNGTTWVDIKDATSSSLSLTPEDYELSGNLYRLKIDNGGGFIYSSNSKITVFKNVEITSQPVDLIVWNTKNAEFEVSATGDGTVKYQWQALVGEEWRDIENATSPNLLLENVSTEMNGSKYRCVVSNEGTATLYSNEATLTVYKTLEIITQPKETYTFEGDSTTFSVAVDAQGDVTYQWQELIANVWTNIENETSSTFTITTMETSFEGRKFRAVITNGGDEFISDVAELKLATPIDITKQPTIIDVAYVGKTAVFSVEVNGYSPEYQWYVSGNYGTEVGVEIAGATGNTLSILVENDSILENVYFCKITNAKATLTTDLVYVNEVQTLSAFQEWSMANGLGVDALPTATPHNDGITNLEKFVFGLDGSRATSYGANPNFKHSVEGGVASFQFPVRKDASGISVKLMMSNDMSNWEEADAVSIGESGEFNLFNYSVPLPLNGKVFFKLKVLEK